MKLNDGFELMELDQSAVLAPVRATGFSGMVKMNRTACFIVRCLGEDCSRGDVLQKMADNYDADEATLSAALDRVLDLLRGIGALDE